MKAVFPILLLALCDPARAMSLSGVVKRLKREIPHARITLVASRLAGELYQDDDYVDEIQVFDNPIFSLATLKLLKDLCSRQWGLCLDIGPSLISKAVRSKTRFTLDPRNPATALSQIRAALHLGDEDISPHLRISPAREAGVRTFLDDSRGSDKPMIVMAPGAGWLGRKWPTERFAVLATRLMRDDGPFPGAKLLILGTQADHDSAVALRMATPRAKVMELTGKLDLLSAYAAIKHGDVFIGNDEIWLHLAAAGGVTTFGLFGPSDDSEAPEGDEVHIVRGPRTFADIQAEDPKLKQMACHMLDLSIDKVYDSIVQVMAEVNKPSRREAAPVTLAKSEPRTTVVAQHKNEEPAHG